jgi:hypothetical protein
MNIIKKFTSFINETYETDKSGSWLVYTKDNKVIGCNLSQEDALKLSKKKGEHIISGQNGRVFTTIDDAQKWHTSRHDKRKLADDKHLEELTNEPVRKTLLSMSNLIKRRFSEIDIFAFSFWVGKFFNVNKFLFVSKVERSQHEKDVKHVYCIVGDYYYDHVGFYTYNELMNKEELNKWNMNDFIFKGDLELVKQLKSSKKIEMSKSAKQELLATILNFRQSIKD